MAPSDHAITPPEEGQSVTASFDLSSIPALRDLTYTTPLARARAIKATLTKSQTTSTDGIISVLQSTAAKPSFRKKRVEDDPENHIIKSLREAGFEWGSIANILNSERVKRGEEPTFTQPAVYSRFVRNAPKIAAAAGEVGFDPKDFMHIRHPHHYSGFEASGTVKRMGVKDGGDRAARMHLGQSHNNVRKKAKLSPDTEELETADLSEMLAKAVERVQRNIWAFVADEMERATGKLYEPRALESRFRAL
ncbi:hypothetical protein P154DRAFT_503484 [Amniculicola lignicola CBS 123094]|uniref:Uncharacterized protein n=1 Tax=Amniculicola lignicola CBS 123094 TaxID=1392246 RepID=A0A6A5W6Z6_9PLEO|nr:hypothetical protein P154DRAFT_503484 [Amniculicola lignicola CBS 123094]